MTPEEQLVGALEELKQELKDVNVQMAYLMEVLEAVAWEMMKRSCTEVEPEAMEKLLLKDYRGDVVALIKDLSRISTEKLER